MELLERLHTEVSENIAWRQEHKHKLGNMPKWGRWIEAISNSYHGLFSEMERVKTELARLKRERHQIESYLAEIGEDISTPLAIPTTYYETRSLHQRVRNLNNPLELWSHAMTYCANEMERKCLLADLAQLPTLKSGSILWAK